MPVDNDGSSVGTTELLERFPDLALLIERALQIAAVCGEDAALIYLEGAARALADRSRAGT